MRLAYLTRFDVSDRAQVPAVGGAGYASYYIARTLQKLGVSLQHVNGLTHNSSPAAWLTAAYYRNVFHQEYNIASNARNLKRQARQISHKLAAVDHEIILSRLVMPLAYLQVDKPLVVWTDGSARGLFDFYPQLTNLCERSKRETLAMEQAALDRCSLIIYSSDWAAHHAPDHIERHKIKVVPFGANCESDRTDAQIEEIARMKPIQPCKLLFIGGAWNRKGGLVACQVAKALSDSGYPTELTVVGCQPEIPSEFRGVVKVLGFVDQARPEGQRSWSELMRESHFLILPSKADCSPHVLVEANSFGLPCLTTNVGGIPTTIHDEVNGKLFGSDAPLREYRDFVVALLDDPQRYRRFCLSSFREFQTRLNWAVGCDRVKTLMAEVLREQHQLV